MGDGKRLFQNINNAVQLFVETYERSHWALRCLDDLTKILSVKICFITMFSSSAQYVFVSTYIFFLNQKLYYHKTFHNKNVMHNILISQKVLSQK